MDVTLIGGGWDVAAQTECLLPFLTAASARAGGGTPRIAFVWVDEGDGTHWGSRWVELLTKVGSVDAVDVAVPIGSSLDAARLDGVEGLFVCGGLTPAYAEALTPAAADIRRVVDAGLPYAGSSAGAAVAARVAVVGGYLDNGRVVCPPDAAEDLEEVTVVAGLALVDPMVDVHSSAWGTLPRLAVALRKSDGTRVGLGLDEDTAWHLTDSGAEVLGRNAVHELRVDGDAIVWRMTP